MLIRAQVGLAIRHENNKRRVSGILPSLLPHPFPSFCFAQLGMPSLDLSSLLSPHDSPDMPALRTSRRRRSSLALR